MGINSSGPVLTRLYLLMMPGRDESLLRERTQMVFELLAVRVIALCRGAKHGDGSVRR